MTDVFVAGALRLPEVLRAVVSPAPKTIRTCSAGLDGHTLVVIDPAHSPAVVSRAGATVEGLLLCDLSTDDCAAITYYQRCFARSPYPCTVSVAGERREAIAYVSETAVEAAATSLCDWASVWTAVAARMAEEIMAHRGRKPAPDMVQSLHSMRMRASAWCAAQQRPADLQYDLSRDVIVHAHKREYVNFFAMEEMDLQYRQFDGSMGPVINRGAMLVGEAAVLLPYDIKRDAVLLVQQFRAAIFIAGEPAPWRWEPPAGLVDPGETPQDAARREAREEAGVRVGHLEPVGSLYPSSGSSGEFTHIFCGLASFDENEGGGGLAGEGEDIRSKVISFQDLMAQVDDRTFQDMPLVTAALWLARHRDRLRAEFG
ncbi:NUDIX domain-containing protein [Tritonibacter sp. SIMBA_163]|uniref:NUDIX domain-containing protein n=1 Tax=Tritonibacter sp. SIMBA_163 TaxID=3080868 RepID=UPI00397F2785